VIHPVHQAQLLSYMRLSGIGLGLLINFNVLHLRDGIKRIVMGTNGSDRSSMYSSVPFQFRQQKTFYHRGHGGTQGNPVHQARRLYLRLRNRAHVDGHLWQE